MTRLPIALALALFCLFLASCSPENEDSTVSLPGNWVAETPGGPVTLVLQDDGKGVWRTELDEAPFKWSLQDSRLVLHTKSGGAVAAPLPAGDTLSLDLPGVGKLVFTRSEKK